MSNLLLALTPAMPPPSIWNDYKLLAVFLVSIVVLFTLSNKWHSDKDKAQEKALERQEERHLASFNKVIDDVLVPFTNSMKELSGTIQKQGDSFRDMGKEFSILREDVKSELMRRKEG